MRFAHAILTILCVVWTGSILHAQALLIKNAPESGTWLNKATEEVIFLPNYDYVPSSPNYMRGYIDPTIVTSSSYSSLFNQASFDGRTINTSYGVGSTKGSHRVDETGAANYAIEIPVPQGVGGVVPTLTINYNSRGGNGILGAGWALSGFSAITRSLKTFYHDGKKEPFGLNNNDPFVLDGNRLIPTSGSNGINGTVYRTESETFSRITSYGSYGGGPEWFQVETKNGLILEYGHSNESRDVIGGVPIAWQLMKVTDQNGNYMVFNYINDGDGIRINTIEYTGNQSAGVDPFNKIQFEYQERTDISRSYLKGHQIKQSLLLKSIRTMNNGGQLAKMDFNYGYNQQSFLKEIIQYGSDNSRYNSTIFKYGNDNAAFSTITSNATQGNGVDIITGDYNGDGRTDVIRAHYGYSSGGLKYHTTWELGINNSSGIFSYINSGSIGTNFIWDSESEVDVPNGVNFLSSDYTGDGVDDLLMLNRYWDGSYNRVSSVTVMASTGTGFVPQTNIVGSYNIIHPNGKHFATGDYNGDGAMDYIMLLSNGGSYKAYFVSPKAGINQELYGFPATATVQADYFTTLDYDGDGKAEFLVTDDLTTKIYTFNVSGGSVSYNTVYSAGYPTKYHNIQIGDFNGDGISDLLNIIDANSFSVGYGKGNGYHEVTYSFQSSYQSNTEGLKVGDYNGDGVSDIMHTYNVFVGITATDSKVDIYSFNKNFQYSYQSHYHATIQGPYHYSGDFNGDGKQEEINNQGLGNSVIFRFNADGRGTLLSNIKDGLNNETEFIYNPLSSPYFSSFYVKGTGSVYPLVEFQKAIYVVTKVIRPSANLVTTLHTNYEYEGARLHIQGKGFIGFRKVIELNVSKNVKTEKDFGLNTTFYVPYLMHTESHTISTNAAIMETNITNNITNLGGLRYFSKTTQEIDINHLSGSNKTTTYVYDGSGNVTNRTTNTSGIETETVTASYGQYGSWLPNKRTSSSTVKTRTGTPAYSRSGTYSYDSEGNLTQEVFDSGNSLSITRSYTIDVHGNTVKETHASSAGTRSTRTYYDDDGRFIERTIDQSGRSIYFEHANVFGEPSKITGIDGLITTFEYDPFNRLKTKNAPDGLAETSALTWVNAAPSGASTNPSIGEDIMYKNTTVRQGRPTEVLYYNPLQLERKREGSGLSGTITEVTGYHANGNTHKISKPYNGASVSVIYETRSYDAFQRLASNTVGINTNTYTYQIVGSELKSSLSNSLGQTTSRYMDQTNKLVKSVDNGGTLQYEYTSAGELKRTTLNGSEVQYAEFDLHGNRTVLIEPNGGEIEATFNAFDEMLTQTDSRGNSFGFSYDVNGRMTQRVSPEGTYDYTYINTGPGANMLQLVTGPGGLSHAYEYDNLNRTVKSTEQINGQNFVTAFDYNAFNQVSEVTYPSGFGLKYQYDSYGHRKKILDATGNFMVWENVEESAYSATTKYKLGNGIQTQMTYDAYGFPLTIYAPGVQDLELDFNPANGNLMQRKDNVKGLTEDFTYDNLDRLKTTNVTGSSPVSMNYASNGNISFKTDVGSYSYHSTRKNAVVQVSNPYDNVSSIQQDVEYNSVHQVSNITEGDYELKVDYASDDQRAYTEFYHLGNLETTKYYIDNYEREETGGDITEKHYIKVKSQIVGCYEIVNGVGAYKYFYRDHLGSILTITDDDGVIQEEQSFDAWGNYRDPITWNAAATAHTFTSERGYTGHEHYPEFKLINMNGRCYDPVIGRMLSVDRHVLNPEFSQDFNRYSYCGNNPLNHIDPDGEVAWFVPIIIGAAVFGTANLAIQLANGDVDTFWDGLKAFGAGAVAGAVIGAGVYFAAFAGAPVWIAKTLIGVGIAYAAPAAIGILVGVGHGIAGDWSVLGNNLKILAGSFYLDPNRGFFGQAWQGISRFSWEIIQSTIGHGFSQFRNMFGGVDRVDLFGGGTFATGVDPNSSFRWGVSIGNHINILRTDDSFDVPNDPLLMHEYGHTFDSQIWGPLYLFVVGIPSAATAGGSNAEEFYGECWANRHAARYFGKHYGVDWSVYEANYPRCQ